MAHYLYWWCHCGSARGSVFRRTSRSLSLSLTHTQTTNKSQVRHGSIPELKVAEFSLEGTGAAVDIETTRPGNEITGTFTLSFQGYETDPIAFDASPEEMQERLEALASVETVEVTRSNGAITNPGGFVWDVTFTSDSNAADQDRIQSDDSSLEGVRKTIDIVETLKGCLLQCRD